MTTPPAPPVSPVSSHPYADQQGANPYADQFPVDPPTAPQPPRKGGRGRTIAIGLGVMLLAVGALFAISQFSDNAANASVGDCVHNNGTDDAPDVKVVDCTDAQAEFKVLKTLQSSDMDDCKGVPGVEAAYEESAGSGDSLLLCLGKNTP